MHLTFASSTTMTQESLFDALVYANVPSRTVLTSVLQDGLLKKSIFASNAFIYHFDDIRDGIDLVLRSLREEGRRDKHFPVSNGLLGGGISSKKPASDGPLVYHLNHSIFNNSGNCLKMNELFDSEEIRFACSRTSEDLLNSLGSAGAKQPVRLPSAAILISLHFLGDESNEREGNHNSQCAIPFERVDVLMEKIKSLLVQFGGPILACSDLKRNLETGTIFKFFVEFYRISDCKKFLETSEQVGGGPIVSDQNVQISFEGVQLYDVDRESLFFESEYMNCESHSGIKCETKCVIDSSNIADICGGNSDQDVSSNSSSAYSISHSRSSSFSSTQSGTYLSHSQSSSNGNFEIDLWKIENGLERRTTCMIRNIPNKYTQQMVIDLVNETHRGCFDFLYLRMDFRNRCNVGYAFINFTRPEHILTFATRVNGKRWARFNSDKICHLTFARIQGTAALIEKFRNSKVMFEAPAYRPKLFQTDGGPQTGQELPFPTCL